LAKRPIGHPRHGGDKHVVRQCVSTKLHEKGQSGKSGFAEKGGTIVIA